MSAACRRATVAAVVAAVCLSCSAPQTDRVAAVPADYVEQIESWQAQRAERLRSEDGWLTLAGLHWLEPGANAVGSAPDASVRLEADGVPARVGTMHLDDELSVRFVAAGDGVVTLEDGTPVGERVLSDDNSEAPDVLQVGRLTFYVIRRGERIGVRVKDPQHPSRLEFAGLEFFPVDPALRIEATWRPHDEPVMLAVPSVIGQTNESASHGTIEFELDGETHTLQPMTDGPDDPAPWVVFKDRTAGHETYGAGRFLATERDGDRVLLDFNRAYNPPCAYTPYATCPLPPPGNSLPVRIAAGEKTYTGAH